VESLAERLRAANDQLRRYAGQVEELAITRERNRLAREIHDSLGHYLTVVNVQIEAARAMLDRDRDKAAQALDRAQGLTREGLADVRRSVSALRESPLTGLSLGEALERLAETCRTAGLAVDLTVSQTAGDLDEGRALTVYRSVQEALTNARKHAQASKVTVRLSRDASRVTLTVADDGRGCADPGGGFGLRGLCERAQTWRGDCRVETAPGEGFRLTVSLPLHEEAAS